MMEITGSRTIAAPLAIVEEILLKGRQLAQAVPDLQLNAPSDGQQRITLFVFSGPLQGEYEAAVVCSWPETAVFQLSFNGHSANGTFRGSGRLQLEAEGDQTALHYDGDIGVTGQLANLPPRLLQANVNAIIRRVLDGVERILWPELWSNDPKSETPSLWLKTAVPAGLFLLAALLLARFINKRNQLA